MCKSAADDAQRDMERDAKPWGLNRARYGRHGRNLNRAQAVQKARTMRKSAAGRTVRTKRGNAHEACKKARTMCKSAADDAQRDMERDAKPWGLKRTRYGRHEQNLNRAPWKQKTAQPGKVLCCYVRRALWCAPHDMRDLSKEPCTGFVCIN